MCERNRGGRHTKDRRCVKETREGDTRRTVVFFLEKRVNGDTCKNVGVRETVRLINTDDNRYVRKTERRRHTVES